MNAQDSRAVCLLVSTWCTHMWIHFCVCWSMFIAVFAFRLVANVQERGAFWLYTYVREDVRDILNIYCILFLNVCIWVHDATFFPPTRVFASISCARRCIQYILVHTHIWRRYARFARYVARTDYIRDITRILMGDCAPYGHRTVSRVRRARI